MMNKSQVINKHFKRNIASS